MAGRSADMFIEPENDPRPGPAVVAEAWQARREEIMFADQFVAAAPGLDVVGKVADARHGRCPCAGY